MNHNMYQITVGTVDGVIHTSKEFSGQEIQDEIDRVDGYIGSGKNEHIRVETVEEALEFITDMLKYDSKNETHHFSMEMGHGVYRSFNVKHVVWWELNKW